MIGRSTARGVVVIVAIVVAAILTLGGCAGDDGDRAASTTTSTEPTTTSTSVVEPATIALALCNQAQPESTAPLVDPELGEISGITASPDQPGVLWVHNDSGAPAVIWAIDDSGGVRARIAVTGAQAVDWEDIAAASGPNGSVLYIADIGDNSATTRNEPARIHRIPEPDLTTGVTETDPAAAYPVTYADGRHDAEALLADPVSGDLFVLSKQRDGTAAGVYRLPAEVLATDPPTIPTSLERVTDVAQTAGALVTAADVSADGTLVAVRTYTDILLWAREPGRSIAETLAGPPTCSRRVKEPQGEAMAIGRDNRSLVTTSEGTDLPLHWLRDPNG